MKKYDSLIVENFYDAKEPNDKPILSTIYVVFNKNLIQILNEKLS